MLRSIQVLRAVAATGVVVLHADRMGQLHGLAARGAAGVDLFFVISGFIMATVATDRTPGSFLADRVWRIFPLWFVALTPWLALRHTDLGVVLTSLTLWPVWNGSFFMPALGVGWSLCFEMMFYGAFALALATRAAVPLILSAAAAIAAPFSQSVLLDYLGDPLILEFLAGVAIARLPYRERLGVPLLLVSIAWFAFAPAEYGKIAYGNLTFLRVACWGIPAALMVYSARCLENRFGRAFDLPVLVGDSSYAVYLFHPLVVGIGFLPGIAFALGSGVAIHRAIEQPLMALRRKWRSRELSGDAALNAASAV